MIQTADPAPGVRLLTLDRPAQRNAFLPEHYEELADAFDAAARDDAVGAVVLTGAGPAFSAGADRSLITGGAGPEVAARASAGLERIVATLHGFPKPYLAAVNGPAVGIGAGILLHADLVVVGDAARIRFPFTSLGLAPEAGASVLLPARVGEQHAAWLLFSSEWLDAARAVEIGFAWKRVADHELLAAAVADAAAIAQHPLASLVQTKRVLRAAYGDSVRAAAAREHAAMIAAANGQLGGSSDG